MELITLCGAVILVFGLWAEFESKIMAIARTISNSNILAVITSSSTVQKPLYVKYLT
jgi:hypothetical protein